MFTRTMKSIAIAVAVAASTISCAPRSSLNHQLAAGPRATFVNITNNNWSDMKVYALIGGVRFRLGMVNSMASTRIRIPQAYLGHSSELSLFLQPIGGRIGYTTQGILLDAGSVLECTIQNNLRLSTIWISG